MALKRSRRDDDTTKESGAAAGAALATPPEGGPRHKGVRLGDLLKQHGLVSEEQIEVALAQQKETGKKLGHQLVALGYVHERALAEVLAEQLDLEVVDLRHAELDAELVNQLPEKTARELHAIPVQTTGARIEVAVGDPLAPDLQSKLIQALESPVRLVVAGVTDIQLAIDRSYSSTAKVDDAVRIFEARAEARRRDKDVEVQEATPSVVDENAPVVQVVNLMYAL